MIVEINAKNINQIPNDSILIKRNNKFEVVKKKDLVSELVRPYLELRDSYEEVKSQYAKILEINPIERFKTYDSIIYRLRCQNAFLRLSNDINQGLVEDTIHYDELKEWADNPTEDIPDKLKGYM